MRRLTDFYGSLIAGYQAMLSRRAGNMANGKPIPPTGSSGSAALTDASIHASIELALELSRRGRKPDIFLSRVISSGVARPVGGMTKGGVHNKLSDFPGWLGALVQYGRAVQMYALRFCMGNQHTGWNSHIKTGEPSKKGQKQEQDTEKWGTIQKNKAMRWWTNEQEVDPPWAWAFDVFPPPASVPDESFNIGDSEWASQNTPHPWMIGLGRTSDGWGYEGKKNPYCFVALPFEKRCELLNTRKEFNDFGFNLTKPGNWGKGRWLGPNPAGSSVREDEYLANARWLVWACEAWRCASPEPWWRKWPSHADGPYKDLLYRWRHHCLMWAVGFAGENRLKDARRKLRVRMPIAETKYTWEVLAELVMLHTGTPGDKNMVELLGSNRTLCNWPETASDSFAPGWRWPEPQSWIRTIFNMQKESGAKAASVVYTDAAAKAITSTVASQLGGALSAYVGSLAEYGCGRLSTTFGQLVHKVFASPAMIAMGDTLAQMDRLGEDIKNQLTEAVNLDEVVAGLKSLYGGDIDTMNNMEEVAGTLKRADEYWGFSDDLWGGIETDLTASAATRAINDKLKG